jgi:transposase
VRVAFCWSHVRRRFYELAALERIGMLYAIESEIRGGAPEERRDARQEMSRPILDALQPWLREKRELISQKTKLAEAIRYALSRWAGALASACPIKKTVPRHHPESPVGQ